MGYRNSKSKSFYGKLGEDIALKFLKNKGYKFLQNNFKSNIGEIDLIFRDKKTLVFVEVKLRENPYYGPAVLAVNKNKQKKIIKVATYYLQSKNLKPPLIRFDIVGIDFIDNKWVPTHYENAFDATDVY